jgi:hypothetical protein
MISNRTINVVGSIHSHRLLTQMPPKLKWATASGELTEKTALKLYLFWTSESVTKKLVNLKGESL